MARNNKSGGLKAWVLMILLILVGLAALVLVAERYLAHENREQGRVLGLKRYIDLREHQPYSDYQSHPSADHLALTDSLKDGNYRLRIDKDGFIEPSRRHKHPDLTLVFLGGSTTECNYVAETNRFPLQVALDLEKDLGIKVNAFNGGVGGNHTLHSLNSLVNKVIPLKPDMVLILHNINDLNTLLYEGDYYNENPSRGVVRVQGREGLYDLLKKVKDALIPNLYERFKSLVNVGNLVAGAEEDEWAHLRGKKLTLEPNKLAARFRANLVSLVRVCQANGIAPVLLTQANRFTVKPDPVIAKTMAKVEADFGIKYDQYRTAYRLFNQTVRQVSQQTGAVLIDLAAEIPQTSEYMYDPVHFNDAGSKLAGRIIADKLKDLIAKRPNQ